MQIQPERPVVDVFEVEGDPFLEVLDAVAPADLPEAGEAGFDAEAAALRVFLDAVDLVNWQRAGADEAHLAFQNVEELWQLVDAQAAQPGTKGEDTGVVADFENGTVHFIASFQ